MKWFMVTTFPIQRHALLLQYSSEMEAPVSRCVYVHTLLVLTSLEWAFCFQRRWGLRESVHYGPRPALIPWENDCLFVKARKLSCDERKLSNMLFIEQKCKYYSETDLHFLISVMVTNMIMPDVACSTLLWSHKWIISHVFFRANGTRRSTQQNLEGGCF